MIWQVLFFSGCHRATASLKVWDHTEDGVPQAKGKLLQLRMQQCNFGIEIVSVDNFSFHHLSRKIRENAHRKISFNYIHRVFVVVETS